MEPALVDEFVEHFDHHDPRLGNDPWDVYHAMLSRCPVAHSDQYGGFWIVSDYETVHEVLQNHRVFTTEGAVSIPPGLGNLRALLPLETDPPLHSKYRSPLAPVFSPARIAELESKIRQICDELIDSFIDRGECEFVAELSEPLPTRVFTEMMGLPFESAATFHRWKNAILHEHHDDPGGVRRAKAGQEVIDYLTAVLEDRRSKPRDDIMSILTSSEAGEGALTDEEVLDITYLLFLAGLDTVTSALNLSFYFLAQHPSHRDRLVAEPSLIPSAVEELLRYDSLVPAGRTVREDTELNGFQLKRGDRVLCNTISANRDPKQFPDPDAVIFDRNPNRHIAFSSGPHRCVGSHLARAELRVVLEQMHARLPHFRLRDGAVVTRHISQAAGLDVLPLVWDLKQP